MGDKSGYIVPMIDRALEIINYMYENGSVGISQISQDLDLPKATIYRILFTLSKWDFVEKDRETEKYFLGKSFIKYGSRVKSHTDIVTIAAPFIDDLAEKVGESVNLGVPYDEYVLTIYNAVGEDFYLVSKLIPISPLNCSAMGKLYLTYYPEEKLRDYFEKDKAKVRTINSITDLDEFLKIREKILEEGVSYDNEEYEYGLTCIGAPILDCKNNIIATISISGPTSRLKYKGMDYLKKNLIATRKEIEKQCEYF